MSGQIDSCCGTIRLLSFSTLGSSGSRWEFGVDNLSQCCWSFRAHTHTVTRPHGNPLQFTHASIKSEWYIITIIPLSVDEPIKESMQGRTNAPISDHMKLYILVLIAAQRPNDSVCAEHHFQLNNREQIQNNRLTSFFPLLIFFFCPTICAPFQQSNQKWKKKQQKLYTKNRRNFIHVAQ